MSIIFFDLETSDKEPCGQILNYCFIRTDDDFNYEDELSGEIRLSVLQIPTAGALLTNRIKVLDHQKNCSIREPEALQAIVNFISNSIAVSRTPVYLIGYNSARFDLGFIRTSLIRNGINPYFGGKIKYHDILFLVRKAYVSNPDFPLVQNAEGKLSLTLENVSKALGLLEGIQTHHSKDDVLLSIELCKALKGRFAIDPLSYRVYEPMGTFCSQLVPDYENSSDNRYLKKPLYLLTENYRSALWIDLDRYAEGQGRAAISWYNKTGHQFMSEEAELTEQYKELINQARDEFRNVSVENFFPRSNCDIEQDIYRLDMQKISRLADFIQGRDRSSIANDNDEDCRQLATRYWLAYGVPENKRGDNWRTKLREYADYRYGEGLLQLAKAINPENQDKQNHHPTLRQILAEIENYRAEKTEDEDLEILKQLEDYITSSEIYKCLLA